MVGVNTCTNRIVIVANDSARTTALAKLQSEGITTTPVPEEEEGLRVYQVSGRKISHTATEAAIKLARLKPREVDMLRLMAEGLTHGQIGTRLGYTALTMKAAASTLYRKIDALDRSNAVAIAHRLGILGGEA